MENSDTPSFTSGLFAPERGFTLVELVIGLTMSAIVMSSIFIIVSGSHEYMIKGRKKKDLQQDQSLIDLALGKNIREGIYGDHKIYTDYASYTGGGSATTTGSCVKLYFPEGDSTVLYEENNDFKIQKADLSIASLIPGKLVSLSFAEIDFALTTAIVLASNGDTLEWDNVHKFRNGRFWPYILYTDTDDLQLDKGDGTISGDVHSNFNLDIDYVDYSLTGEATAAPPQVGAPAIDWTFFLDAATAAGQYVTSDKTFDAAGSPYTGVWYTTKKAKIKNAVINGTVIAEEEIEFESDNASVTATPSNYPALISGKKVKIEKHNITINGFIYGALHVHPKGNNMTINGAIVAGQKIHSADGTNKTFTYDKTYTGNLKGLSY